MALVDAEYADDIFVETLEKDPCTVSVAEDNDVFIDIDGISVEVKLDKAEFPTLWKFEAAVLAVEWTFVSAALPAE